MADIRVLPKASALIEALRDIGYTLEAALADVIDNSITAGAGSIEVRFDPDAYTPFVAVVDDGCGMSEEQLITAMRPGSRSPLEDRDPTDLGRFGLGLKTASFSQCRCLTVVTRANGKTHAARWDLDYVTEKNDWLLQKPPAFSIESVPGISLLRNQGTLVVWQKLDRLADKTSGTSVSDHLTERMESARRHLELVFHRFMEGDSRIQKLEFLMNGRKLKGYDPFHSRHSATQRLPVEVIPVSGSEITVEPYILPHHNKVSPRDWEHYAGEGGYLRNQGFYLYRGGRLIIHGTWFRLARQSELTKLARVKVDMPNGLDHLWKIDVKKAFAQPPFLVRDRLKKIIDLIAEPSKRVYTSKGHRSASNSPAAMWIRRKSPKGIHYEINWEHPSLRPLLDELPDEKARAVEVLLKGIERGLPIDALFSDAASDPKALNQTSIPDDDLNALVQFTVSSCIAQGAVLETITDNLKAAEPYRSNWDRAQSMIKAAYEDMVNA